MAEIRPTSDGNGSRRDFLRKTLLAGGVAASAPVIATFGVPAGAQAGSGPVTSSLSFTVADYGNTNPQSRSITGPDSTSAAIQGTTGCALPGYTAGQSPTPGYAGSGTATRTNGATAETASLTISGLPSAGTCTVTVLARCGPDGGAGLCTTVSTTKASGSTSVTFSSITASCGGNTGFRKFYVTVTC